MNRRDFLKTASITAASCFVTGCNAKGISFETEKPGKRPNILWITFEDISPDLGCYGDEYAISPNLDKLASEGTRFDAAFTNHGVCAPVRSCTIMGMYPNGQGTNQMRCKGIPEENVRCYTQYLRQAGYYCTNNSKTDYQFDNPDTAWDESSKKAHWKNRPEGKPFFAIFNFTSTHESRIRTPRGRKAKIHDPDKAKVPPYYPDNEITRNDWAVYADNITETDRTQVSRVLRELQDAGLSEDTIVWFWGDHGRGLPRAKRWIYESGMRIPLIIKVPGKFQKWACPSDPGKYSAGTVSRDLVSSIDFSATMLSLAGVRIPDHLQGQAFMGPQASKPRKYVYGARDRLDEAYDCMRCIRDHRYRYIRNYNWHIWRAVHVSYMDLMPTMQEMRRLNAEGKLKGPQKQYFEKPRPVEELYDVVEDPHEVNNLAGDPNYKSRLIEYRKELKKWMLDIGDVGLIPECDFDMMKRPLDEMEQTAAPGVKVTDSQGGQWCKVELNCNTPGSEIAFNIEGPGGTHPGTGWQVYTDPVIIKAGQKLKCKAVRIGFKDSKLVNFKPGDNSIAAREDTSKEHWKRQLGRTDLVKRLLEVRDLDLDPENATEGYFKCLKDPYGPVRYWGVVGLHLFCRDDASKAKAAEVLKELLNDTSQSVPIAAAEALVDWGYQDALKVLVDSLENGRVAKTKLYAAHSLYRLGEKGRAGLKKYKELNAKASGDLKNVLGRVVSQLES